MLDCVVYCNFISTNLISRLNLVPQKLNNKIHIKGISGDTDSINEFVSLNFQLKIKINCNEYWNIRVLKSVTQ